MLQSTIAPAWADTPASSDTITSPAEPARVIVKLKSSSSLLQQDGGERMQRIGQRMGLSLSDGRQIGARTHVATMRGKTSAALAAELAQQTDVEYAVVDQRRKALEVTPNDPLFGSGQSSPYPTDGQWYAHAADATLVSAINAPAAWALSTGSPSVVVAVVDTGVRYDHVDLAAKLLPGYNFISEAAIAGNSVGRSSDASDLGDYLTSSEISANSSVFSGCSASAASSWHGTVVSGIIGADTNNGTGIAGVGWNVKILPVRVLGKCGGYDSDIIAGMRWAAGLSVSGAPTNPYPARVINLSLGGTGTCSQAYLEAVSEVTAAGALVVAAAGNESTTTGTPANCTGVIGVAALRHVGTKAGYSSLGSAVGISAPGGNCVNSTGSCSYGFVSTTNSGSTTPVSDANGGSTYTDANSAEVGTSFSAPLVSATAALMFSAQPTLTPAQVTTLIKSSARAFPTTGGTSGISQCRATSGRNGSSTQDECYCTTTTCGAGMLDVGAAVAAALGTVVGPSASITVSPDSPTAGQAVTLSAAGSQAGSSSITSYQWSLVSGGGIVTSLSSATGQTVTATPTGAGTFSVTLTVADGNGQNASTTQSITVSAAAASVVAGSESTASTSTSSSSGGGGGGGGALDAGIVAALAAWLAALWAARRGAR
jgi:serine protease